MPISRMGHRRLHQGSPDAPVLDGWVDGDRPNSSYGGPNIHEVAAEHTPIVLSNATEAAGMVDQHRRYPGGHFNRREVGREVMFASYRRECLVEYPTTFWRVGLGRLPNFSHMLPPQ